MVPFNVARIGESRFHCGTQGTLAIENSVPAEEIARCLTQAQVPAEVTQDIQAVLWGKLAMNLNNAVNALSGLPLKAQLSQRDYRKVLAASVAEALAAMKAAGITPAKIGKVRPQIIPKVVGLPDWLFRLVAANMLKIDKEARSSMAEDLDAGREPEIDWLNGEIVRLGEQHGVATPVNARITELVKQAFDVGKSPRLSGKELLAMLQI
jgi:2-dehydropantoate 2-reductase